MSADETEGREEIPEASAEESRQIAAAMLREAAGLLERGDLTHADAVIRGAETWLRGAWPEPESAPHGRASARTRSGIWETGASTSADADTTPDTPEIATLLIQAVQLLHEATDGISDEMSRGEILRGNEAYAFIRALPLEIRRACGEGFPWILAEDTEKNELPQKTGIRQDTERPGGTPSTALSAREDALLTLLDAAWSMCVEQQHHSAPGWSMAKSWAWDNLRAAIEVFLIRNDDGDVIGKRTDVQTGPRVRAGDSQAGLRGWEKRREDDTRR